MRWKLPDYVAERMNERFFVEKYMEQEQLDHLRHSCAHLLAAAVMELYSNAKRTIGPAIENGFYYDFDFGDTKVSEDDFPKIEAKMLELVKTWKSFERKEVTKAEALKIYKDNEYKKELIEEFTKEGQKLTLYTSGKYTDLCRGGHCTYPDRELKFFDLLSVAGAYWRGSEKNKMLTRIYGTCFDSREGLDEYLKRLTEAKKRDHRKIGKELGLFAFSDLVGAGLPMLTPKGATIRRILERFIVDEEIKRGYQHVVTPPLAKVDLYRTSGHYPYYKETMYPPMNVEQEELILRPMTCPHHFMLYKSQQRSWRELPMRLAELASQFRYEKSGELSGLMRVRMFTLADAHIITPPENAKEEITSVLDLIDFVNKRFGMVKGEDYRYRLSLGDRKDTKKYFKDDGAWDEAERVLRDVLDHAKAPYFEAPNEAAFYGPKIDVQIKNIAGHEETAFTVQYDFVMPKRFDLTYVAPDGTPRQPIVIHRSSLGAFERTMAFLIEKYNGAFPLWLAPVQVTLIPIAERHVAHAQKMAEMLRSGGIRVETDEKSEPMGAKIRNVTLQKVPYMGIIGDKEVTQARISVRTRKGEDLKAMSLENFLSLLQDQIEQTV
jgi:threonyl-tRNA synthetase